MKLDSDEDSEGRIWNQHDYIFGLPKFELAIVMIATVLIFWFGQDYIPWPLAGLTTVIYFVVRQWQVRREFNRFMGRRR